jgi:hypothetical protein
MRNGGSENVSNGKLDSNLGIDRFVQGATSVVPQVAQYQRRLQPFHCFKLLPARGRDFSRSLQNPTT